MGGPHIAGAEWNFNLTCDLSYAHEFLNDVKDVKDHITTMRAIKGELNVYPLKVLMEKFRDRCPHYVVRLDGGAFQDSLLF